MAQAYLDMFDRQDQEFLEFEEFEKKWLELEQELGFVFNSQNSPPRQAYSDSSVLFQRYSEKSVIKDTETQDGAVSQRFEGVEDSIILSKLRWTNPDKLEKLENRMMCTSNNNSSDKASDRIYMPHALEVEFQTLRHLKSRMQEDLEQMTFLINHIEEYLSGKRVKFTSL